MSDEPRAGMRLSGSSDEPIGTIDAVFADYLLVRTASLLPVDLYVPRPEVQVRGGELHVDATAREAYGRWHRPLKRAPHE